MKLYEVKECDTAYLFPFDLMIDYKFKCLVRKDKVPISDWYKALNPKQKSQIKIVSLSD